MNIPSTSHIGCPHCGNQTEVQVWKSVNVTMMPGLRQQVLDRTLHKAKCSHCGKSFIFNADFLYHDMDNDFMLSLVRVQQGKAFNIPRIATQVGSKLPNYNLRFVTSYNQLLEKILIFETKLNDFAIEGIKLFAFAENHPHESLTDESVYFAGIKVEDGKRVLLLNCYTPDGYRETLNVPYELYEVGLRTAEKARAAMAGEWKIVNQTNLPYL